MKTLLTAKWVAPMDQPMIRDGGVVFEAGRILGLGTSKDLRARHPDAQVKDAGECVMLPGLVNAHVHLELSDQRAEERWTGTFVEWLGERIRSRAQLSPAQLPAAIEAATTAGVEQCLRFGVTTVGDITRFTEVTRRVLDASGLGGVSFGEVIAMGKRAAAGAAMIEAALDQRYVRDRLAAGVAPHAPYTVNATHYRKCLEISAARHTPITTHLAESPDEREFLADHSEPLRELWNSLGSWEEGMEPFRDGPIRFVERIGLLGVPAVLAHVNYCDNAELDILARGQASVVYCPRTHAYFGHPPHRWREMLARGINVAVGTDSRASSPDLNLVDDLRLLRRIAPEVPPAELWSMATIRGARALGQTHRVGSLSASKSADVSIFPVKTPDPLAEVLENDMLPNQVWVGGRRRG